MKKVLFILSLVFSITATAQNYADSSILLTLTQRSAVYVGFYVKNSFSWSERTTPAYLKDYIQNGTKLDSVFTVSLKASFIKGLVDLLLGGDNEVVQTDRLSIINNSPSVPGYTGLASQIVALANGNGPYKQVAIWVRDYYNQRITDFANLRTENIQSVVTWSKN